MVDNQETEKFRDHMSKKLSKRDLFEDSVDEIVGICTEVISNLTYFHTCISVRVYVRCLELWCFKCGELFSLSF